MLVQTLEKGKRIYIECEGHVLALVLVEGRGRKARIGLEGPRAFVITREELLERAPHMSPAAAEVMAVRRELAVA